MPADNDRPVRTIFARTLYDGLADEALPNQFLTIADGAIAGVEACSNEAALAPGTLMADVVTPGFIDMQINGAADTQFNEEPTVDAIARIASGARKGGTAHILPTFITAPDTDYARAIDAANGALRAGISGVLGVHLEGPFLSTKRPGIHPANAIRPLAASDVDIIKTAQGVVLLTLAPEEQDLDLVAELASKGVCIFVGHSQASFADMDAAIAAGVRGVTHLFNAQSQIAGREPGVVGTALMHPELSAGIIADGFHVHPQNLTMAAKLMGERLCLVTDAMKTLAGTLTGFDLYGTEISLADGRLTGPDGTLAGAQLAMDEAVRNAIALMGVSPAQAVKMATANPAMALGISDRLGTIKPGHRASLTLLNSDWQTQGVIVEGVMPA